MTDAEKIEMVALMTDETSSAVVAAYLNLAKQTIFEKAFPFGNFPEEMPSQYDGVHVEAAVYMINRRGAEGETVHLENGVSRHWETGTLPDTLLRRIIPFAGVPGKKAAVTTGGSDATDETEP